MSTETVKNPFADNRFPQEDLKRIFDAGKVCVESKKDYSVVVAMMEAEGIQVKQNEVSTIMLFNGVRRRRQFSGVDSAQPKVRAAAAVDTSTDERMTKAEALQSIESVLGFHHMKPSTKLLVIEEVITAFRKGEGK